MKEVINSLYKPNSLAVIRENCFFQRSDGIKGKVLERMPNDKASAVRYLGGVHDIVFWDDNPEFKYYRVT